MIKRFDRLDVATSDLSDAASIYEKNFGFEVARSKEHASVTMGGAEIRLGSGGAWSGLYRVSRLAGRREGQARQPTSPAKKCGGRFRKARERISRQLAAAASQDDRGAHRYRNREDHVDDAENHFTLSLCRRIEARIEHQVRDDIHRV